MNRLDKLIDAVLYMDRLLERACPSLFIFILGVVAGYAWRMLQMRV